MAVGQFHPLRLAGGTALALQLGHRRSVDLDLFGSLHLEELELASILQDIGNYKWLNKSAKIKSLFIDNIKTDFVNYNYPWIKETVSENGLRLAHKEDIAAMKLAAITGRGSKKDFVDLFFLLEQYNMRELLELFNKKYADGSELLVLKSLIFFEDAEQDEMPEMLKPVEWEVIKKNIRFQHHEYVASL